MGTVTHTTLTIPTPRFSTDIFRKWVLSFKEWQKTRREMAELAQMSDYQLKDIGLTRNDLYRELHLSR